MDWTVTLRKDDKNPFGGYILFKELKQIFPSSLIETHREPAYNVLHDKDLYATAYCIIAPNINLGKTDIKELLKYAESGNDVFIASTYISKDFLDTLGLEITNVYFNVEQDSSSFNLINPALHSVQNYQSHNAFMGDYFSAIHKKDSTVIIGINQKSEPDFIKITYGSGAIYLHCAALCFSNYFMLLDNNDEYVAKALSYIKPSVTKLFWDEYYKAGREGADTPLRFFLSNEFLKWALWITSVGFLLYILFEMKRRQRIIPVIEPPRNTSMDFVQTVSTVYLAQKNNYTIAAKKIQFWFDYIRRNYFLQSPELDDAFIQQLSRKSGTDKVLTENIIQQIKFIQQNNYTDDESLLNLNSDIDKFYQLTKKQI